MNFSNTIMDLEHLYGISGKSVKSDSATAAPTKETKGEPLKKAEMPLNEPTTRQIPESVPAAPIKEEAKVSVSFKKHQEAFIGAGQESTISLDSLQRMNGFVKTQIGKMVEVDFLLGQDLFSKIGRLETVGSDYIVLVEEHTSDIVVCTFGDIKFIRTFN